MQGGCAVALVWSGIAGRFLHQKVLAYNILPHPIYSRAGGVWLQFQGVVSACGYCSHLLKFHASPGSPIGRGTSLRVMTVWVQVPLRTPKRNMCGNTIFTSLHQTDPIVGSVFCFITPMNSATIVG